MFDSVTFQRSEAMSGGPVDLGALAETLLFYQRTNLLLDANNLNHLLTTIGASTTLRLISSTNVNPILVWKALGVETKKEILPIHNFVEISLARSRDKNIIKSKEDRVKHIFQKSLGSSPTTNKAAMEFSRVIKEQKLSDRMSGGNTLPALCREELEN